MSHRPATDAEAKESGFALRPLLKLKVSISPASWDFGDVQTDGVSTFPAVFTVTNNDPGTTGPLAVSLQGGDADQFILFGGTCSGNALGPGNTCTQNVFTAITRTGPLSAAIVITANPGGTATAALAANGVAIP
jgi:hypothetical protein